MEDKMRPYICGLNFDDIRRPQFYLEVDYIKKSQEKDDDGKPLMIPKGKALMIILFDKKT